jgi:hypothetical protein
MNGYERNADGPVWQIALPREYITPEDVTAALDDGAPLIAVARDVLVAIDLKATEDASLCAFNLLAHDRVACTPAGTPLLGGDS